jgi:hypothetical protein
MGLKEAELIKSLHRTYESVATVSSNIENWNRLGTTVNSVGLNRICCDLYHLDLPTLLYTISSSIYDLHTTATLESFNSVYTHLLSLGINTQMGFSPDGKRLIVDIQDGVDSSIFYITYYQREDNDTLICMLHSKVKKFEPIRLHIDDSNQEAKISWLE